MSDKNRQSSKKKTAAKKASKAVSPKTIQRARLIKILESGKFKDVADAMRQAGYAESTIDKRTIDLKGDSRVQEALAKNIADLEKAGITRESLAERMALLLDEAEPKTVLATVKHAHKMMGVVDDKIEVKGEFNGEVNMNINFLGQS